jgi:ubiquinone/menaquinone biosynthesis C-methylase UbiE
MPPGDDAGFLALAGPREMTPAIEADFSDMVSRIYRHCSGRRSVRAGHPYMAWDYDLRARRVFLRASPQAKAEKLEGLTFTPHMNERRDVVGSQFQFRFERRTETLYVPERVEFTGLQTCLSGNEFERVFPIELSEMVHEGQWGGFGKDVTEEVARHYETIIHPRVVDTVARIGAIRGGRPLTLVDLGGGSGTLAELLCERVPEPQLARVIVIERSEELVGEARERANRLAGRLEVRNADILATQLWSNLDVQPDVFVLCGVVAHQVLEPPEALHLMQSCLRALGSGGFVLVPSYSPALLTSAAYERMGFAVRNKTLSFFEERTGAVRTNDFYVLEKP